MSDTVAVSLRDRIAQRRDHLRDEYTVDIPVPGYGGILVARYKQIDYRTLRQIGTRQEHNKDKAGGEVNVAADTLSQACVGLFGVDDDGELQDLGHKWSTAAAREIFGIDDTELPEGTTVRDAILRIFPSDTQVVMHFAEYDQKMRSVGEEIDTVLAGESEASSEEI